MIQVWNKCGGVVGLCVALTIVLLPQSGCKDRDDATDYPPPGAMRVVEVMPLEAHVARRNLIRGGAFTNWMAGAVASSGFWAPGSEYSALSRRAHPSGQGYLTHQQWAQPENANAPTSHFRTTVTDLQPDTEYEFIVTAASHGGVLVALSAWESPVGLESLSPIARNLGLLEPSPGVIKQYRCPVRTFSGGTVLLTAYAVDVEEDNNGVSWYEWALVESDNGQG